jgi:geranylgeranyl diphosphate synthase, type II
MVLTPATSPADLSTYPSATLERERAVVEAWLEAVLPPESAAPSNLHRAMRHAVLGGGKRVRPLLVLLVAGGYGELSPAAGELAGRMAASVELVHCASLVHDDMPAFDDAPTRRGRPSCHAAFGEPTALLVGDALLSLAFETLSQVDVEQAPRALRLLRLLGEATGSSRGIIGGQAMELEPRVELADYHVRKTAALFRAAAAGGAVAVGQHYDAARWGRFGELLGVALQLRDDLDDCLGDVAGLGKPAGVDARLGRPNAVLASSVLEARHRLSLVLREATTLIGEPSERTLAFHALVRAVAGSGSSTSAD